MSKYLLTSLREYIFIILTATVFSLILTSKSFADENIFVVDNVQILESIDVNFSRDRYINKAFLNSFETLMSRVLLSRDLNKMNNIKAFLEKNDLKILKSKKIKITKEEASEFYKVHQTKPFYNDLCFYLSSGPIIVMILEGENVIKKNRDLMGATDPKKAKNGTIRNLYGISIDKNSIHGSDSPENAKIEISFFFD